MLTRVVPQRADWLDTIIATKQVSGLIVIGQSDQSSALDHAASEYLPMVAWGAYSSGQVHCSVGTENYLGGRLATRTPVSV